MGMLRGVALGLLAWPVLFVTGLVGAWSAVSGSGRPGLVLIAAAGAAAVAALWWRSMRLSMAPWHEGPAAGLVALPAFALVFGGLGDLVSNPLHLCLFEPCEPAVDDARGRWVGGVLGGVACLALALLLPFAADRQGLRSTADANV